MNRLIAILLFIVVAACNRAEQKSDNKSVADSAATKSPPETPAAFNPTAEIEKLNNVLKPYESKPQTFTVSSGKKEEVRGKKGTLITVDPSNLETVDGKPLGKTIEIELKEVTNAADFVYGNARTTSDGKLLVSGGAYYINMTSDGSPLRIKQGKTLSVRFPKNTDENMELFYGQRDSLGQMNWEKTGEKFEKKEIVFTDSIKRARSGFQRTYDIVVKGDTQRNVSSEKIRSLSYPNQGPIVFLKQNTLFAGDTMRMTKEERKNFLEEQKKYETGKKKYDELYSATNISSLGWINCDRFLNAPLTDLIVAFRAEDSITSADIFVVLTNMNSVISAYYFNRIDGLKHSFPNMPVDYKAKLIAFGIKGEKIFADAQNIAIEKDKAFTIHLKNIEGEEFKKLLNSN
jgi:hypothetical protein